MQANPFEIARQALATTELYADYYASSEGFREEMKELAEMLNKNADEIDATGSIRVSRTLGTELLRKLATSLLEISGQDG